MIPSFGAENGEEGSLTAGTEGERTSEPLFNVWIRLYQHMILPF